MSIEQRIKKVKRVIWADEETEKMLLIVRDNNFVYQIAARRVARDIHTQISNMMASEGYTRTPEQIRTKLKSLRKDYREAKKHNQIAGAVWKDCEFYDLLDQIYGNQSAMSDDEVVNDDLRTIPQKNPLEETSSSDYWNDDAEEPRKKRLKTSIVDTEPSENNSLQRITESERRTAKIKRVIWADEETEKLLTIIRDDNIISQLAAKKYRNTPIYNKIVQKLSYEGYVRTANQIRTKVKAIRKEFNEAKKHNMTPGAERKDCDFYDILDEIFGNQSVPILEEDNIKYETESIPQSDPAWSNLYDTFSSESEDEIIRESRQKSNKRNVDEIELEEDTLFEKNREFWSREFKQQRQHEKELNDNFCNNLRSIFNEFSLAIRNLPNSSL